MLPGWVRRLGYARTVLFVGVGAILLSELITAALMSILFGDLAWKGLAIGLLVPILITLIVIPTSLRLVFALDATRSTLEKLSITDELTQAYNRRHFMESLEREMARSRRFGHPFSLLLIDLDDFKEVNDTFGHAAGDDILVRFSEICRSRSRQADLFARLGGDEFAFLLPELNHDDARQFAERLAQVLSSEEICFDSHAVTISICIGAITWSPDFDEIDRLLKQADDALYTAKRSGKARIVQAEEIA